MLSHSFVLQGNSEYLTEVFKDRQLPGQDRAKARSQKCNEELPQGWLVPNHLSHHLLPARAHISRTLESEWSHHLGCKMT